MMKSGCWVLAVPLLLSACGKSHAGKPNEETPMPEVARSPLAYERAPSVDPSTEAALVSNLDDFGLEVLKRLAPGDQNFVVSPVSGFMALTMASAGARGTTADEMKAVLYPSVSLDQVHPATNLLGQRVRGYARPPDTSGKNVELNLANDLFAQRDFAIEPSFLDTLAVNYDSGVELVDFAQDPDGASARINNWVAKETNDRIEDLLPPGAVDLETRLVLVDALYLLASWSTAFDPNATYPRIFHGIGSDAATDFMNATLYLAHGAGNGWVAVDVPYFGGALVFTAVLPDEGQFDAVKAGADAAWLASFDAAAQVQQIALSAPKFKLTGQTVDWSQTLQDLGMTTLFDRDLCQLEGINPSGRLYVKSVLQQVYIELAEKGTEAAAATAVIVNTGISLEAPPTQPLPVVLDRPFLFFIRERAGPVLFVGQVMSLPAN